MGHRAKSYKVQGSVPAFPSPLSEPDDSGLHTPGESTKLEVFMHSSFRAAAIAALVFVCGLGAAATLAHSTLASASSATEIKIDNYTFKPASITVAVGTTIVWKNLDDEPHTATASNNAFDSKGLALGDAWSYHFTKPGTYAYYCKVHPFMKGTVIVKESQ
jgi:plastocyanin